ncbi:hypothetical protein [Nocardia sp. NPDC020380]
MRNLAWELRTRLLLAALADDGMSTAEYSTVELYIQVLTVEQRA